MNEDFHELIQVLIWKLISKFIAIKLGEFNYDRTQNKKALANNKTNDMKI